MKYAVVTFGCRVNQADSLGFEEELLASGAVASSPDAADLVVVNTCSVTATADQGARQTIRRIARDNPHARIVVTGCYATRKAADVAALPGVAEVVCNDDKPRLVPLLRKATAEHAEIAETNYVSAHSAISGVALPGDGSAASARGEGPCGAAIEPGVAGRTAFTLRVQTGCEERCTYCIIPATRGPGRSVAIEDVVRDVERVAASGFKEIALTGVHLGSYGRNLARPSSLFELLGTLARLDIDVTFRISSLEPMDCTPEVVDLVAGSGGRFAPHFHLPLQHASDRMLEAMGRPYTLDHYRRLLDGIHARLPHASIGSDLIVGFPGETDDDFAANLAYLPDSPLTHLHVFPYSDRPGTVASALRGKVDGVTTRARGMQLRTIGAGLTRRFQESQCGTIRPGLTLEDGTLVVTDNYLKVRIPAGQQRNQRVNVRVEGVSGALVGRVQADPGSRIAVPGNATHPSASRDASPALPFVTIR
jgi:threonylcarbamoyladenosine tRNA methylthiotransferase MtaB